MRKGEADIIKKITPLEIDLSKEEDLGITGFRIETPICIDNVELGNLKIDFDSKEKINSLSQMSKNEKMIFHLAYELENYVPFFKKKIESELRLRYKYSDQIKQVNSRMGRDVFTLLMTMPLYNITKGTMSQLGTFLYEKEDEMFKLIKSEGPILLCHPAVQKKIIEWLSDKDIAKAKINKLKNSLLGYALETSGLNKLPKRVGAPKKESTRKIEKSRFGIFYLLLLFLFRKIKKNKELNKGKSIKEIIEHEGKDLFISLSKIQTDKKAIEGLKGLDMFVSKYKEKFYCISDCIENDEDLKREFNRFKWQPNKIVKEILAKILDVSVSTIESRLYR